MNKTLFVVAIILGVAFAAASSKSSFADYMKKYNKSYKTSAEYDYRFNTFQANVARAAAYQASEQEGGARFGVTKFMDLSAEEFAKFYRMPNVNFSAMAKAPSKDFSKTSPRAIQVSPDPTNFDWGSAGVVTPVYDQGQCGSCWAFSATETIESYHAILSGNLASLSMEQIVDCDTTDQGCGGGFPSSAYQYVQSAGGIEDYNDYPYTAGGGNAGSCSYNSADDVTNVANYNSINGESGLYSQLSSSSGGPISVCVDASSWQYYQGGVLTSCTNNVDHCVQATGYAQYGQSGAYWNVRNSWGADWGESGYIWVAIGQDLCSIGDYATVVSTTS